jgi:hypothetical protein
MLENLVPQKPVYRCSVGDALSRLDVSDRAVLVAALADEVTWSAWGLSKSLKARGVVVGDTPIRSHRLGACRCEGEQ